MKSKKTIIAVVVCLLLCVCLNLIPSISAAAASVPLQGDSTFRLRMQKMLDGETIKSKRGRTYYVAVNGKDSNSGTKSRPFKTIRKGISKLKKGDTLLIGAGRYPEILKLSSRLKGDSKNYITIASIPGAKVVIDGANEESPVLLRADRCAYVQVSGLEFQNAVGEDSCAIKVSPGTHHLILSENRISNIKVLNPTERSAGANGILLLGYGTNAIHNVFIYKNKVFNCVTGWSEAITASGNVKYINVVKNYVDKTGNIGIDFAGNYGYCPDESKDFPRYGLIYGNTVRNCKSPNATSYGIYVDGGQYITVQRNKVEKCTGGIEIGAENKASLMAYATSNIQVKYNRVINNEKKGITVGGYQKKLGWVRDVIVEKNICKNNGKAILTLSKCSNIKIKNNTFVNESGKGAIVYSEFSKNYTKNIYFDGNTYYNGGSKKKTYFYYLGKQYSSFTTWAKAVGEKRGVYQKL